MTAKRDREDRSTGPAKVVPATMMMIGLEKLAHLSCLPGVQMTVPHKHVVVITLVLRSQHTNIRIDIKELEGGGEWRLIFLFFLCDLTALVPCIDVIDAVSCCRCRLIRSPGYSIDLHLNSGHAQLCFNAGPAP